MERRAMLSSGLLAGVVGALWPVAPEASAPAAEQGSENAAAAGKIVEAIQTLQEELRAQRTSTTIPTNSDLEQIRNNQRIFFRGQGKFPDYIDVSLDVWEKVYDWYIRTGQPIQVARLSDGRYTIPFMLTNIVLRPDVQGPFISLGYDPR